MQDNPRSEKKSIKLPIFRTNIQKAQLLPDNYQPRKQKKDQVGKLNGKNMISAQRAQNHPKLFSLSSTTAFSTFPMGTFGFFAFFLFASQYKSPPASHYQVNA